METKLSFEEYCLSEQLVNSLKQNGLTHASAVQDLTITPILDGQDIFAQAETGSGKTGSFAIPILEKLWRDKQDEQLQASSYVVLSPTRELAQQTHKTFENIGNPLGISSTCLIGGENIERQKDELKKGPHVLIVTPGRLLDLIKQKIVDLKNCQGLVFDEADRLFDMGFKKEIEEILRSAPKKRQLIMVSATSNMEVLNTAYKFDSDPIELKLNEDSLLVDNIDHKIAMVSREEKMPLLVKYLRDYQDAYALVFCNTQIQTHLVAEWLRQMGHKAKPISGRLAQNKRTQLMEQFRSKEVTILVCTDVAARGLDVKDVNLVINYDMPQEAANYVHRIGRTGRAGKKGEAVALCAHEDCENLEAVYKLIGEKIPKLELTDADFARDVCPRPYIDHKTLKVSNSHDRSSSKHHSKRGTQDRRAKTGDPMKKTDRQFNGEVHAQQDQSPLKRRPKTELMPYIASERPESDGRDFYFTTDNKQKLERAALGYFGILDTEILHIEVVKKGWPKFLFFGARNSTYRVSIKPIYKRILVPFLSEIINLAGLRLFAKVSYKNNNVRVSFDGADERMLSRNRYELLNSFEHLIKTYLYRKVKVPKDVTLEVRIFKGHKQGDHQERNSRPRARVNKDEILAMVEKAKNEALETGEPVLLKPLNSSERRLVHQYISENGQLSTESIGDGRLKRIEISPL